VGDEQLTLSTVPVLAFIDAADPIEQPRNWAGAQKFFPNSRAIALPGQGHDVNSADGGLRRPADTDVHRSGQCGLPGHQMPG
jgi:hypothetical protein